MPSLSHRVPMGMGMGVTYPSWLLKLALMGMLLVVVWRGYQIVREIDIRYSRWRCLQRLRQERKALGR